MKKYHIVIKSVISIPILFLLKQSSTTSSLMALIVRNKLCPSNTSVTPRTTCSSKSQQSLYKLTKLLMSIILRIIPTDTRLTPSCYRTRSGRKGKIVPIL